MHTKTLKQLSELLHSKQVSATELATQYLARIKSSDLNAFLHVLFRHGNARLGGIHNQMRRLAVIRNPLVESPQEVGPLRRGYCLISSSTSVRLS